MHWALSVRQLVALVRLPYRPLGAGESAASCGRRHGAGRDGAGHLAPRPVARAVRRSNARGCWWRARLPSSLAFCWRTTGSRPRSRASAFSLRTPRRDCGVGTHGGVARTILSLAAGSATASSLVHGDAQLLQGATGCSNDCSSCHRLWHYARYHMLDGVPVLLPLDVLP